MSTPYPADTRTPDGHPPHRTLVILGHPDLERSRVNRRLVESVHDLTGVTVRDLAAHRGVRGFDVDAEQTALRNHDTVVFQFPWYWYSVPGILKEWMDQVLTYGFAYGTGGVALRGKRLLIATSTGGPRDSYSPAGYNGFEIEDLMRPFEATANLCGMTLEEPVVLHGVRTVDDEALARHASDYRRLLARH